MGNEITIIEQKTIEFQGDEITAIMAADDTVYIPMRPICETIGVDWNGQRRRINRDAVLSEEMTPVNVTYTGHEHDQPQTVTMMCLPLKYLNGFLFGLNPDRVKPEIRDKVIAYQRDCYDVLYKAFMLDDTAASHSRSFEESETIRQLMQIRDMGLSIVHMAEEQIEHERRLNTLEERMMAAALYVKGLDRRLTDVERRVSPGSPISDAQAAEIKEMVKALAMNMAENPSEAFPKIWGEIYRRFGVSSYKLIPQSQFAAVMEFLREWE